MQGHSGAADRNSGRSADAQGLRLLINPPRLQLDDRTVIFKYTGDGGWFCASFGDGAKYMRAAKEDPVLCERIAARAQNIRRGRDRLGPDLARVMAAIEVSKDYDPEQPRDEQGRWTNEGADAGAVGASGVAAGSVAVADTASIFANSNAVQALEQIGIRATAAAAAVLPEGAAVAGVAVAGAALVFRTLFIPANKALISSGTLPDAPDFAYRFDQGRGHLTVTREHDDGTSERVFDGRPDAQGVFRDEDGNAVGRFFGESVALDADAIRGYEARRKSDSAAQAGAAAQSIAIAQTEPKLCPDPTVESIAGRKLPALLYQSQISGLPPGVDFRLIDPKTGNDVSYDACWPEKAGEMGEAKGPNYFKFMIDPNHWYKWYQGVGQIKEQMGRQARAAGDRQVEWHFAEQGPADYFRRYVEANPLTLSNIHVFYTPPINQQRDPGSGKVTR